MIRLTATVFLLGVGAALLAISGAQFPDHWRDAAILAFTGSGCGFAGAAIVVVGR